MGVIPPILFWPAAAVLAALAVVLVMTLSARASRRAAAEVEDPAHLVYRRQLDDLDDMVERGLLRADEREAARAEAARRLLAQPTVRAPERPGGRLWPVAAAAAAALAALGLYLWLGAPGTPDQPFKARLAQWRNTAPEKLRPDELAAALREVAKTHPDDPRLLEVLGKVERQNNDPVAAARDFEHASRLDPNNADLQAALGEALNAAAGDKGTPEAEAALRRALAIDPNNQSALYYLGGARAAAGDKAEAARLWRQLAGQLDDKDVRKAPLLNLADRVEKGAPPEAQEGPGSAAGAAIAAAPSSEQAGFIRGMVATLQARLDAQPDDPAGWARLIRSYRVLGDQAAEDKALARVRTLFAKRPADLATAEAGAK